jgi:phage terminase small subunit
MPVLKNARHEIYAQNVANGMMLNDAYREAGFEEGNPGNPSRLRNRKDIDRRITELLNKRANKTIEKYAAEVEYTREVLLAELENARSVAEKAKNGSAMAMGTLGIGARLARSGRSTT